MRVVSTKPYGSDPRDGVRAIGRAAALASLAAGMIHVAAAADHAEIPVMMVGFELVAILQVALGCLMFWRLPGRPLLAAGLAMMVASVALWAISRTTGLGWLVAGTHVEPVGFRDSACVLFELVASVGLLVLLRGSPRPVPQRILGASPLGLAGALALALGVPALITGGHSHGGHSPATAALHAGLAGDDGHVLAPGADHESAGAVHPDHAGNPGLDGAFDHSLGLHDAGDEEGHAAHAGSPATSGHTHGSSLAVAHDHGAGAPSATTTAAHVHQTGLPVADHVDAPGAPAAHADHGSGGHPSGGSHDDGGHGGSHGGGSHGSGHHPPGGGGGHHPGHGGHEPDQPPPEEASPGQQLADIIDQELDSINP